jgi:hypothetical protein
MRPRILAIALVSFVIIIIATVALSFSDRTGSDTRGWTVFRQLDNRDEITTTVVQIDPGSAKDRSVCEAAVKTLCSMRMHGNICIVGFFLPGDDTPSTGPLPKWGDYKPLAIWWANEATGMQRFTFWDCFRAGIEGSPPSALCGAGVKEAYNVALALGARVGIGEFCNWPSRVDIPATLATIVSETAKYGRSAQMKAAYEKMFESGRNTGHSEKAYDCSAFHAKLDAMVDDAVSSWRASIARGSAERR